MRQVYRTITGNTRLMEHGLCPSKESVDTGSTGAMGQVLGQLKDHLASPV